MRQGRFDQSFLAVLFIRRVSRFGNAVREENDALTRIQRHGGFAVDRICENAEDRSAFCEALDRTVRAQEDWGVVSGVRIRHESSRRIDDAVEKADEATLSDIAAKDAIHLVAEIRGANDVGRKGADGGLQV